MIDVRFKECCTSCTNIDVDYDQVHGCTEILTVIGCRHACVCGAFNAEEPMEEASPDVTIRGFQDADG